MERVVVEPKLQLLVLLVQLEGVAQFEAGALKPIFSSGVSTDCVRMVINLLNFPSTAAFLLLSLSKSSANSSA